MCGPTWHAWSVWPSWSAWTTCWSACRLMDVLYVLQTIKCSLIRDYILVPVEQYPSLLLVVFGNIPWIGYKLIFNYSISCWLPRITSLNYIIWSNFHRFIMHILGREILVLLSEFFYHHFRSFIWMFELEPFAVIWYWKILEKIRENLYCIIYFASNENCTSFS